MTRSSDLLLQIAWTTWAIPSATPARPTMARMTLLLKRWPSPGRRPTERGSSITLPIADDDDVAGLDLVGEDGVAGRVLRVEDARAALELPDRSRRRRRSSRCSRPRRCCRRARRGRRPCCRRARRRGCSPSRRRRRRRRSTCPARRRPCVGTPPGAASARCLAPRRSRVGRRMSFGVDRLAHASARARCRRSRWMSPARSSSPRIVKMPPARCTSSTW